MNLFFCVFQGFCVPVIFGLFFYDFEKMAFLLDICLKYTFLSFFLFLQFLQYLCVLNVFTIKTNDVSIFSISHNLMTSSITKNVNISLQACAMTLKICMLIVLIRFYALK